MTHSSHAEHHILRVKNFRDLVNTPFHGEKNAICWERKLRGDFSEIVNKIELHENMTALHEDELRALQLSEQGQLAREILLNDLELLKAYGADPTLNVIRCYERDDAFPFFPTDVYSFHVDRSPVPTDTFLCTYHGAASEILANSEAIQKIHIPEIRDKLKKLVPATDEAFESLLTEHFFDLHYQARPGAQPFSLGTGHLWRLAIDHPESPVPPCIHRAPEEKNGEKRLLLIC